jgi:CRISPR-associated protein Cmr6
MPIAAVPSYLGDDFKLASPGMRFSMYLPLWGIDRRTNKKLWTTSDVDYEPRGPDRNERQVPRENKGPALATSKALNENDKRMMAALVERQRANFVPYFTSKRGIQLDAVATAPFTTGLGNEHPLENGFAFLNPYGLPYLSGSGIKGVVRQAAQELARGDWGDTGGWSTQKTIRVANADITLSIVDVMFGLEPNENETRQFRGVLTFWDAIPQIDGDSLLVEVMTPHQTHYYQQSESPHESGKPNPILFLTVPPQSKLAFYLVCDVLRLSKISPDLAADGRCQQLVAGAFEHAFYWLGFGAKTSLGYGAMRPDQKAKDERTASLQKMEKRKALENEIKAATAGLPEDAAWLIEKLHSKAWPQNDNSAFLKDMEDYLATREKLSAQAYIRFSEEMERRWKGIMFDPDAVEGKKGKPKFKERQKALAKRLLELKPLARPETAT